MLLAVKIKIPRQKHYYGKVFLYKHLDISLFHFCRTGVTADRGTLNLQSVADSNSVCQHSPKEEGVHAGDFTLKLGFGSVPDSLTNSRISKLNLRPGQVSELPEKHSAQLGSGEQAVILFQPFPSYSHQQRLEGDHRASKAAWGKLPWSGSPTARSGDRFQLQQVVSFTGLGGQQGASRRPRGPQPFLSS